MHTTIIRLLWTGGALALLLALGAVLGTAMAAPAASTSTGPLPTRLMHLGCGGCYSFGIGNATPVAVHNGDPTDECPRCVLLASGTQYFWPAISGPGSPYDIGDPYNTKYLFGGGYNGFCPGQIDVGPLNPSYIAGPTNRSGGHSHGLRIDPARPVPLTIYVYDPAQYYRPASSGNTDPDTFDSQPCYSGLGSDPTRYRFRTFYTVYAPDTTPDNFLDDVPIYQTSFVDTNDPLAHNHWFALMTLDPGLAGPGLGDFRLQVTTDDLLSSGQYGVGNNQYALALGGERGPFWGETIYDFFSSSRLNNIRAVPNTSAAVYALVNVQRADAGGQMITRAFDLGDFNCNTQLRLLNPAREIAMFKHDGITETDHIDTTICSPGCVSPYKGLWTSLWVDLPADYQGGEWLLRYDVAGSCRNASSSVDRTVWEVQVTSPGTTPSPSPPSATATPCVLTFSDVPGDHPFYPYVRCLACRGIISGYADGTFRPDALVTRGQASKMIALAAGLGAPVPSDQQTFEDVPAGTPFWAFIELLAGRGYSSGYTCGGADEPCVPPLDRPYFRPYANITRGQIAKVDANAASYTEGIPPTQQTFADVPPGHPFWIYIERVNLHGVISGYGCGGPDEPCVPPLDRPYFRPFASATRGQTAKIVANAFFPNCQTPHH